MVPKDAFHTELSPLAGIARAAGVAAACGLLVREFTQIDHLANISQRFS